MSEAIERATMDALNKNIAQLKDRIWFTRKARIESERRLLKNDAHAQKLLALYSLYNIALTVLPSGRGAVGSSIPTFLPLLLSVALFGLSLYMNTQGFKDRAFAFRKNYTDLYRLYEQLKSLDFKSNFQTREAVVTKIQQDYADLLRDSENHTPIDDQTSRFHAIGLVSRLPTLKEKLTVIGYSLLRCLALGTAYLGPLAVFLYVAQ